jgi:hypothetical protein
MEQPIGTENRARKTTGGKGKVFPEKEKARLAIDEQRGYQGAKRTPWYARILCMLKIHSGPWVYLTKGACGQFRACVGCGQTQTRTKHQLEWQYVNQRACEQNKVCLQCGGANRGLRIRHEWDCKRDYASERRQCTHCGKVQIWGTTREQLCKELGALGLNAGLAKRGRPEEKSATFSMGLVEIVGSPIRWVNVRKWDNEGPVYATEYGVPDSRNLPTLQIRSVLMKSFPVFGRAIDVRWKGDDKGTGAAQRLSADPAVRAALMASGRNVTVHTSPECRCWLIPHSTKHAPSALRWDCFEKIAANLLANNMTRVER